MLLNRQDYTEEGMRRSLRKKGFSEEEVERNIDFLKENDLINDGRYAKSYIDSKKEVYGTRRLAFFLKQKGVDDAVIEGALFGVEDGDSAVRTARRLVDEAFKKRMSLHVRGESSIESCAAHGKSGCTPDVRRVCGREDREEADLEVPDLRWKSNLVQKLIRRGFSYDVARDALERVLRSDD